MSLATRNLPPQILTAEEAAGKCKLPCRELVTAEHFGTVPLTHNQSEFLENNLRAKIENARTVAQLDAARQHLDCLVKWRRQCLPELANISETRKRVEQTGREMEKEMAEARAQGVITSSAPPTPTPPAVSAPVVVYTYEGVPGVSVVESDQKAVLAAKRAKARESRRKMDWER